MQQADVVLDGAVVVVGVDHDGGETGDLGEGKGKRRRRLIFKFRSCFRFVPSSPVPSDALPSRGHAAPRSRSGCGASSNPGNSGQQSGQSPATRYKRLRDETKLSPALFKT